MIGPITGANLAFAVYVIAFGVAAIACFACLSQVSKIEHADTRRGLFWLLATTGGWSSAMVLFLLIPGESFKITLYTIGLIIGLATIGPWLYFCSAYTGRSFHRNKMLRRWAIGVFLLIVLVKLTNPVHGLYFSAESVSAPFSHLSIQLGLAHWIVMGLLYALAGIGYFMLFELFAKTGHDVKPLVVLALLAGVPVLLDISSVMVDGLLEINYEPLGVAVFGVGVLFLYLEDFQSVKRAGEHDDPVIVLDADERIRDYNLTAQETFPELEGAIDGQIQNILPEITTKLNNDESLIEIERGDGRHYYGLTSRPFLEDQSDAGIVLKLTDITNRERYRRELEHQNERLERFASIVSHDLRNPLSVAKGHLELRMSEEVEEEDHLETVYTALERMEALIEDVLSLARQGQPIDEMETVVLTEIVQRCWSVVDTREATIQTQGTLSFAADPERLKQLFENLFRNSVEHGGSDVEIRVGPLPNGDGFFVEDDGDGIPPEERNSIFEFGYSTDPDGTGFGLAIVHEIVNAHNWSIRVTESEEGGARFEISDIGHGDTSA